VDLMADAVEDIVSVNQGWRGNTLARARGLSL